VQLFGFQGPVRAVASGYGSFSYGLLGSNNVSRINH
jgi:hypothetical protein